VLIFASTSSWGNQIINQDFIPNHCAASDSKALPEGFAKAEMWKFLQDLDTLELTKLQRGWTKAQQDCSLRLKQIGEEWLKNFKEKPSADLWAFRAGFSFYTNPNKTIALSAAQEAQALTSKPHAAAGYFKAVSLRYTQTKDITDALVNASISTETEPFDQVLRKRAMLLLKPRLTGQALFVTAQKWAKAYPKDVDVILSYFDAAIQIKNIKSAKEILEKLKNFDLSATETSEPALRAEILTAQKKFEDAALIYSSLLSEKNLRPQKRDHYRKRYLEAVVAMKSWNQVRTILEQLLLQDPSNQRYQTLLDASVRNGAINASDPINDLEKLLKLSPESIVIKYALAQVLINEFENGARQDKAVLIARAETLASQLSFANSIATNQPSGVAIDVAYLNARVLFLKRVFSKAENEIVPAIKSSKEAGVKFQTSISDLYEIAARIAWARGDWGEAKRLAREGISRIPLRPAKEPLQRLLQQIP
jgi:hypothetical protein